MKAVLAIFFGLMMSFSQDTRPETVEGSWQGTITAPGVSLRLVFHIKKEDGQWSSTMDSPDQGIFGLKMDKIVVDGNKLEMKINQIGGSYEGTLKEGKIEGKWSQSGQSLEVNLERVKKGTS